MRWLPAGLLAVHLLSKSLIDSKSLAIDLILYNAIWIFSIIAITQSPLSNDPIAVATISLAVTFWGIGSTLNSYGDFYSIPPSLQLLAQLSYTLFYPLALIAIPRVLNRGRRLNPI